MKKDIARIGNILRERPYGEPTPLDRFSDKAKTLLPKELHDRFRTLHVKDGVLTVACFTTNVAYIIRKHEHELLDDDVSTIRTMLSTWR